MNASCWDEESLVTQYGIVPIVAASRNSETAQSVEDELWVERRVDHEWFRSLGAQGEGRCNIAERLRMVAEDDDRAGA